MSTVYVWLPDMNVEWMAEAYPDDFANLSIVTDRSRNVDAAEEEDEEDISYSDLDDCYNEEAVGEGN